MTDKPPLLGRDDAVPRRRWRWLLPTLIGLAVVALVATVVVRFIGRDENAAAKDALVAYLEALETNSTTRAYGMLCADDNKPALKEFAAVVKREREDAGGVLRHRLGDVERKSDKLVVATYTVQFERTYKWVAAALVHQDGEWKPCGFRTIPRPEIRLPASGIPEPPGFSDTGTTTTTR